MAVSINNIPNLSFTHNEVKVQLTSDNYMESEGVKGVYHLGFTDNPGGGGFRFILHNKLILYGFGGSSGGLSYLGYHIPSRLPDESLESYMPRLRDAIDAGFEINSDFIVTYEGDQIVLTARNYGTDYTLGFINQTRFTFEEITAPVNRAIRPGFKHHLQIWSGDLATKIYETDIPLDFPETGITTVDISSILHSLVALDVPNLTDVFQRCPNSLFEYIIKYANRYGSSQAIKELKKTPLLRAVLGGYSMMALAHIDDPEHLQDYLLKSPTLYEIQNWYESYPLDDVEVKTNHPQFLYFINSRNIAEVVRIRVAATLTDGTTQIVIREAGEVASFEKVCFNVGYEALGLSELTDDVKQVIAYTVNLIGDDNEPRTVVKNFKVNRQYEANTRYFLYAGSDGNFKTLRTYGMTEASTEVEPVTGVSTDLQAQRIALGDVLTYDVEGFDSEEVQSGYIIGKQQQNNIKELLLSTSVYRVFGSKLVPIQITSKTIALAKEKTGASTVKIGYRIAWNDRLYTGDTWALNVPQINQSQEALNDI